MLFNEQVTTASIAFKLAVSVAVFFVCSLFAMIIIYVETLQLRLKDHNVQNIKLLDGMHEGLLILS